MNKKKFIEVDLTIVNLEDEVILSVSGGEKSGLSGIYGDDEWLS